VGMVGGIVGVVGVVEMVGTVGFTGLLGVTGPVGVLAPAPHAAGGSWITDPICSASAFSPGFAAWMASTVVPLA
jgi:hypothetical protein